MEICANCGGVVTEKITECSRCGIVLCGTTLSFTAEDFDDIENRAFEDDCEAMFLLYCAYKEGIGTDKNEFSAFYWLKEAADHGCIKAYYNLSLAYANGLATPVNPMEAKKWLDLFESNQHQNNSSSYNTDNIAVNENDEVSVENNKIPQEETWFDVESEEELDCENNEEYTDDEDDNDFIENDSEEDDETVYLGDLDFQEIYDGAVQGDCDYAAELAVRYAEGEDCDQDLNMAFFWAEKAESMCDSDLCREILCHFYAINKDVEKCNELLRKIEAEDEFYAAQVCTWYYGLLFEEKPFKEFTELDFEAHLKLLKSVKMVAEDDIEEGLEDTETVKQYLDLLEVYMQDINSKQFSRTQAQDEWLYFAQELVDCGETDMMEKLADKYDSLRDEDVRYAKRALALYEELGENGNVEAQYMAGIYHEFGIGTKVDHMEANQWYETAARANHAEACTNFAYNLHNGIGVGQNHNLAVEYYLKAAEQGQPRAMYNLGCHYEDYRDYVEAARWYKRAKECGYEDAKQAYKNIIKNVPKLSRMFL